MTTDPAVKTRKVFDAIHRSTLGMEETKKRLRSLVSPAFLGVPDNYFEGKICADLGCGSSVNGTINLLNLGAGFVNAIDVDESFIEPATAELSIAGAFEGRWKLDVGNITELPYDDESFDFASCTGVLHHVDDDRRALGEIARILKPGGGLHLFVLGKGGLLARLMEVARDAYQTSPEVADVVDNRRIRAKTHEYVDWLLENMSDDGSDAFQACQQLLTSFKNLIDEDFELTVQDRLQAPIYRAYDAEEFRELLNETGFRTVRRLKRRPTFDNIRKILSPMYENYDHELSRVFLGTGSLLLFCEK